MAGDVKGQVLGAVTRLGQGQQALAEGDFGTSAEAFSDAEQSIRDARTQLDDALAASKHIVSVFDITGTVRAGTNLLEAADAISKAGTLLATVFEDMAKYDTLPDAIDASRGNLAGAAEELSRAQENLGNVNDDAVPADVRENFTQLKAAIPTIHNLVAAASGQADVFLSLLGTDHDRKYLVLLANNHELRPVGGFIGTVALLNVDRGEVESIDVSSVYDGDGQLKQFIAPPDPLLPVASRWYLRDTNWFVDFPVSARKAAEFFEKEGGPTVDGVILLTPDVIQRMLSLTGPVTVPGYSQIVTAENFVEITQQEVTYEYDKELNRPKQFLADLTPLILDRMFGESENKLQTFQAFTQALAKKEMLLYFRNNQIQGQIEKFNWGGAVPKDAAGIIHVNNANIGGHKSDQFIEQEIDQRLQVLADGSAEVTLTVRRTHRGPFEASSYNYPEAENPAQKDNVVFQRVLVPQGAQLLEAKGFTPASRVPHYATPDPDIPLTADPEVAAWQSGQKIDGTGTTVGQEAGYTFFGNWMITEPGQTSVGLYRYRVPDFTDIPGFFDKSARVATTFVKQAGAARTNLRVEITLPAGYRMVYTAPESGITREAENILVYRGSADSDKVIGAVFEKE